MGLESKGIYIVGSSIKYNNSKYPNDKYDRELYIPKGYILPDGEMLTKEYGKLHEDMAKRFIEENYYFSYKGDYIDNYKDYMLMRLHALQIMSSGKKIVLYCDDHVNDLISDAIVSYMAYGWKENIIPNPSKSYLDYLRYDMFVNSNTSLIFGGNNNEKETNKSYVLERR